MDAYQRAMPLGVDAGIAALARVVQSHWDAYFDETVREAQAGAKVIVWPEVAGYDVRRSDEASP